MRAQLVTELRKADRLKDAGIDVRPYAKDLDALERPCLMVSVVTVKRSQLAAGWRDYEVNLDLLSPYVDPDGRADDELDDALEEVLALLESADENDIGLVYSTATRATFGDKWPSYRITGTVTTQRGA